MSRLWLMLIAVIAAAGVSSAGCRSCSTCHDYDPPVANCNSGSCGCNRAGSAFCSVPGEQPAEGYLEEGYSVEPAPESENRAAAEAAGVGSE